MGNFRSRTIRGHAPNVRPLKLRIAVSNYKFFGYSQSFGPPIRSGEKAQAISSASLRNMPYRAAGVDAQVEFQRRLQLDPHLLRGQACISAKNCSQASSGPLAAGQSPTAPVPEVEVSPASARPSPFRCRLTLLLLLVFAFTAEDAKGAEEDQLKQGPVILRRSAAKPKDLVTLRAAEQCIDSSATPFLRAGKRAPMAGLRMTI